MSDSNKAQWWRPDGWVEMPTPVPFVAALDAEKQTGAKWHDSLRGAGYHRLFSYGCTNEYETAFEITVFSHEKHLLVEVLSTEALIVEFFVDGMKRAAFLADKLPTMLSGYLHIEMAAELQRLRKAVVAFVRHGSGEIGRAHV